MTKRAMNPTYIRTFNDWNAGNPRTITMTFDVYTLPVRRVSIECIAHPEWGTFGVMEDRGHYYELGGRVLSKAEAARFWRVVE